MPLLKHQTTEQLLRGTGYVGIPLPRSIEVDEPQERLLKEYGDTIKGLVKTGRMEPDPGV